LQLLADYLPERLRDLLVRACASWSLAAVLAATAPPPAAAAQAKSEDASWEEANGYVVPRSEDYKKYTVGGPAAKKPKPAAAPASGAAQKRMEQAAKGTMKIASFFKPAVRVEE